MARGSLQTSGDKAGLLRWQVKKMQTSPNATDYVGEVSAQALGQDTPAWKYSDLNSRNSRRADAGTCVTSNGT
jgi:hypothetical protein